MAKIIRQRAEKNCLNCGQKVEAQYCTHCGQENIHPKQPFHYLLTHFIGVKVNYKHGLWASIISLIKRPGHIVQKYIAGQRTSYTDPVNMYVTISFVVFLLPFLLPYPSSKSNTTPISKHKAAQHADPTVNNAHISIVKKLENWGDEEAMFYTSTMFKGVKSTQQLDSIQASLPADKKVNALAFFAERKYLTLRQNGLSNDMILDKYTDTIEHNLPKFLICYLPFFALFLWLFHDKKQWSYFEHSVFTFYYFCFLLLMVLPLEFVDFLDERFNLPFLEKGEYLLMGIAMVYGIVYFIRTHHAVYNTQKSYIHLKGLAIFIVSLLFMLLCFIGYLIVVAYTLH